MSDANAIASLEDGADITNPDESGASTAAEDYIFAPPPEVECALSFSASTENTFVLNSDSVRRHLLFEIKRTSSPVNANGVIGCSRLPLNVALVIDCSGSMAGERIEHARRAADQVIDLLEPADYLTLVSFADRAEVIMPARRVTSKAAAKEHLEKLKLGDRTNLYEGLSAAYQQIGAVKSERTVNRLILLTDGTPTAGAQDFSTIIGQVAAQKAHGIIASTVGLGPDYNEDLIGAIARRSGGNCYHADDPGVLSEVFKTEIEQMARVVARNLRLKVHLSRGVNVRQVHGHQPVFGNRSAEITLGDIGQREGIRSLWELDITHRIVGNYRIARAELVYDDAATGWSERLTSDTTLDFTNDDEAVQNNLNTQVQREIDAAAAVRSLDRIMIGLQKQVLEITAVILELNRVKDLLLSHGHAEDAELAGRAIDKIQRGVSAEKTLMETIFKLDQGKIH